MRKRVAQEVPGTVHPRKPGRAILGGEDRHRVEQDRRRTVELFVCGDRLAARGGHAADLLGDHRDLRSGALGCRLERLEHAAVDPVGHQDTKLAAGKAVGRVGEDAERGRNLGLDHLARGICRAGQVGQAQTVGDGFRKIAVDDHQVADHALPDRQVFDLGQLEDEGVGDMPFLDIGLAEVELAGLTVVVGKGLGPDALLRPRLLGRVGGEPALGVLAWALAEAVRLVVRPALGIVHRHVAILLQVGKGAFRRVDRNVVEVRPAEPLELRVEVGEVPAL